MQARDNRSFRPAGLQFSHAGYEDQALLRQAARKALFQVAVQSKFR